MITNYEHIRKLLEKFYNAETTRAEELELTDFFSSAADLPADLEADRKVFAVMAEAQTFAEAPADLDAKIMSAVDASAAPRRSGLNLRRIFISISAVAAVVALVLLLPFGQDKHAGGNPAGSQLASDKLMDTLKSLEIIPDIPSANQLTANSDPHTTVNQTVQPAVETTAQPNIARAKRKAVKKQKPETEEEYTLSEEELKGLEMALTALNNASEKLAYAYECVDESNSRFSEIPQIAGRILQ